MNRVVNIEVNDVWRDVKFLYDIDLGSICACADKQMIKKNLKSFDITPQLSNGGNDVGIKFSKKGSIVVLTFHFSGRGYQQFLLDENSNLEDLPPIYMESFGQMFRQALSVCGNITLADLMNNSLY